MTIGQLPNDLLNRYRTTTSGLRRESDAVYKQYFPDRMGNAIPLRASVDDEADGEGSAAEAALNVIEIDTCARRGKSMGQAMMIKLEDPESYEMFDDSDGEFV